LINGKLYRPPSVGVQLGLSHYTALVEGCVKELLERFPQIVAEINVLSLEKFSI